jgi:hypothetical protein
VKKYKLLSRIFICFFIIFTIWISGLTLQSFFVPGKSAHAQSADSLGHLSPEQRAAVSEIDNEIRDVQEEKKLIKNELSGITRELYEAYLQQEDHVEVAGVPSGEEIGTVIGLKGMALAEKDNLSRNLELDGFVYEKETIITRANSNVEIRFLDNTLFSQGPDSAMVLDEYVYDPGDADKSGLSINLMQGAFRHVTGRIAQQNPDRVKLESSLSIIGIRGTTTVHNVAAQEESHGVEDISGVSAVEVQDVFTNLESITASLVMVDVFPDQPISPQRNMTPDERDFFHSIAPAALGVQAPGVPGAVLQTFQQEILSQVESLDRSAGREESLGRDRDRAASQSASGGGGNGGDGGGGGEGGGCG